jgi:tripartite-type tricarboxylate transporter receptor subunit TctC
MRCGGLSLRRWPAALLLCVAGAAHAQSKVAGVSGNAVPYPVKAVRIIVSSAPGGGQDLTTRPVAQKLSEVLGVAVVVDNRGGASGMIGMDIARQAAPDGYTLLVGGTTVILMGVTRQVPYDIRQAFDPIVQMTAQPYLLVVHPSQPITTAKEFVAYAKARPGVLTYGTSGAGSLHHLGMASFSAITGIALVHVPYKGSGPALADLLAGHINLMFTSTTSGAAHTKSGRLRAIALTSRQRSAAYPDLPTLSETIAPGYELGNNYSLFAPRGTPQPTLERLNREVATIVNTGEVKNKFAADGAEPATPVSVEAFKRSYLREVDKWERVITERKRVP